MKCPFRRQTFLYDSYGSKQNTEEFMECIMEECPAYRFNGVVKRHLCAFVLE